MATRLVPTFYQAIDGTGNPGNGWKLYFYETGTTTLKDTYSDEALSVANTNPVIADSSGRFVDIFGVSKEDYKVILKDDNDVTIETEDPVDTISYNINSFSPRPYQHWGTTTNTADAYRIKPDPSITSYSDGLRFSMVAHLDNNASCTLAVFEEGTGSTYLSALTMKKYDGAGAKVDLEASDMEANQTYDIYIDTTNAILLNPQKPTLSNLTLKKILKINPTSATISGDAIAFSGSNMVITPEGAAADDLDTISGGTANDILILQNSSTDDITLKHSATLDLWTQTDAVLGDGNDRIILMCKSAGNWVEISRTLFGDFKHSISASGYTALPNGLIMQWGQVAVNGDIGTSSPTDSLPITFPNALLSVTQNIYTDTGSPVDTECWWNKASSTTSTLHFTVRETSSSVQTGNWGISWWAIGY
jgi:hypothetical protein